MGVGVNIFSIMKWGLRLILIAFLVIGTILYFGDYDIFTPLITEHTTTTLVLIGLGCIAFLPIIVPKPKTRNKEGGETVMKKFHIVIVAVIGFLTILVSWLLLDTEGAKTAVGGIGGGIGTTVVGALEGFNGWLTGFPPYAVLIGGGLAGIGFTYLMVNLLIPKIKARISPMAVQPKSYMGEPEYTPPQKINPNPAYAAPPKKIEEEAL